MFFFNGILAGITILSYLSPFADPLSFWFLSLFGLIFPFLLILNFLFILYWLLTRWKRAWLSVLVILLGSHYLSLTLSFSGSKNSEEGFSVVSYNMHYGYNTIRQGSKRYDQDQALYFAGFVKKDLNADILCCQEINRHVKSWIETHYEYVYSPDDMGTSVFSQFPIIDTGKIDFGTRTNSCVWADIAIEEDTIRVYNVHLQSNSISRETDMIVEEAEKKKQVNIMNVRTIIGKYKRNAGVRSRQARLLRAHMDASPWPVILTGDLNDPPVSFAHRMLSRYRQDSFREAGNGFGQTYAGNLPLLRIDNVILDDVFEVLSHSVIRKKFSDHYPVKVLIDIK